MIEDIDAARAVDEIEGRTAKPRQPAATHDAPAAGPHATETLTSPEATPGAGALPDTSHEARDVDGGVG